MSASRDVSDPLPSEQVAETFTPREARQAKRLGTVLALVAGFFVLEVSGAMVARSNVLKADALHLLMDVFALAVSLLAMRLAIRRPTPRFTFGLRRAEPVAAIFNAVLVLGATIEIVSEGIEELRGGQTPVAGVMLVVAVGALVVNGLSAWLLHDAIHHGHAHAHHGHAHDHDHDHEHNEHHEHERHDHAHEPAHGGHAMNLRGARLHLLGDTLGSLAALVAAVIIKMGGPAAVDPIASFVVAGILVFGALGILRDATLVLLEAAPPHLPVSLVRQTIAGFPEVAEIHDMHVWTLGAGHDAITVHVRARQVEPDLGQRLAKKLRETFHTEYVTVQVEPVGVTCSAPPSVESNPADRRAPV